MIRSDVTARSQRGCPQISKPFNSVLLDKQDFDVSFLNSRSLVARKDKRRSKEGGAGADDHIGPDNFIHFEPLVAACIHLLSVCEMPSTKWRTHQRNLSGYVAIVLYLSTLFEVVAETCGKDQRCLFQGFLAQILPTGGTKWTTRGTCAPSCMLY